MPAANKFHINNSENSFDALQAILSTMDVPSIRYGDLRWLSRNLGIKNSQHVNFNKAMILVKELMTSPVKGS